MSKQPTKADIFDVWGKPPEAVTNILGPKSEKSLKKYIDKIVVRCYRIAFDAGVKRGIKYWER